MHAIIHTSNTPRLYTHIGIRRCKPCAQRASGQHAHAHTGMQQGPGMFSGAGAPGMPHVQPVPSTVFSQPELPTPPCTSTRLGSGAADTRAAGVHYGSGARRSTYSSGHSSSYSSSIKVSLPGPCGAEEEVHHLAGRSRRCKESSRRTSLWQRSCMNQACRRSPEERR